MPEPRDAIVHIEGCEKPMGPGGSGYACDCGARQASGLGDPVPGPVPTEHERAWATQVARSTAGVHGSPREHIAHALARHREELLAPIREALAAADGNAPPSAYETLDRIREVIGG